MNKKYLCYLTKAVNHHISSERETTRSAKLLM